MATAIVFEGELLQMPLAQEAQFDPLEGVAKASAVREDDVESTASTEPEGSAFYESQGSSACDSPESASDAEDCASEAVPASFSQGETLIFFDWDDTICPTSWLQCFHSPPRTFGYVCKSPNDAAFDDEQSAALQALAERALALLSAAKECGRVVIVTNGQRGWVEFSCRRFLPEVLPALNDVKVVSARTAYEMQGVWEPVMWKVKAFQAEADVFFLAGKVAEGSRPNVLSIGDSLHEQEALIAVAEGIPHCRAKSVKLVERPTPVQLREEHELLLQCFGQVVGYDGNLDFAVGPQGQPSAA